MTNTRRLRGIWLGRRRYSEVHALQLKLLEARKRRQILDTVLLLEHEPVITLGRGAKSQHLLASESNLKARGMDFVETGRGGSVTLHAPGQLVCYPIIDLNPDRRDVRRYVRSLTRCMQVLASSHGVDAGEHSAYVGLWADAHSPEHWPGEALARQPVKLGAIGVRISRWVTMHGFALNFSTDMSLFRLIVPCGIADFGVGSVQSLTGHAPTVESVAQQALAALAQQLEAKILDFEDRSMARTQLNSSV